MKIITRKVDNQPLTVIVEYPRMDKESERIIEKIKHMDVHFIGKKEDKSTRIDISDVYYFENVERKVFCIQERMFFVLMATCMILMKWQSIQNLSGFQEHAL